MQHREQQWKRLQTSLVSFAGNVSKHLRLLMDEGCVSRRKEGLYSFYRIADPTLSAMCLLVCGRIRSESDDSPSTS